MYPMFCELKCASAQHPKGQNARENDKDHPDEGEMRTAQPNQESPQAPHG